MPELGKAIVVTTEDMDKYSEKKLKQSAIINGEIFSAMRNFSLQENFFWTSLSASVVESTLVYLISLSFVCSLSSMV